jgi:hypothetical protein
MLTLAVSMPADRALASKSDLRGHAIFTRFMTTPIFGALFAISLIGNEERPASWNLAGSEQRRAEKSQYTGPAIRRGRLSVAETLRRPRTYGPNGTVRPARRFEEKRHVSAAITGELEPECSLRAPTRLFHFATAK